MFSRRDSAKLRRGVKKTLSRQDRQERKETHAKNFKPTVFFAASLLCDLGDLGENCSSALPMIPPANACRGRASGKENRSRKDAKTQRNAKEDGDDKIAGAVAVTGGDRLGP
jgi:hypothetical protein